MTTTNCQPVSSSLATNLAITFTFLGALVFVVTYAVTTRGAWRSSATGWNVMAFMGAVAVAAGLAVLSFVFGTNWPGREVVRVTAWSVIGVIIWWRLLILIRVQRDYDRSDR